MDLCLKLEQFQYLIQDYILLLDLVHSTNNWDIDFDIDNVFYKVENRFDNLLNIFSKINIQEMVIGKYYDLLLKKIWKDYQNNDLEYLNRYNDLKSQIYLQNSIKRFLDSNNLLI